MNNRERIIEQEDVVEYLSFNRPQTNFMLYLPFINSATLIWGRGTGKSSGIAYLLKKIVDTMPRSMWVIQGATYQQVLTRTLPGTFAFLGKLGFRRDKDYFINKFPPSHIKLPYEAPLKADNCIFFVNHQYKEAVGFALFSQDRVSSRGPNRDGVICDESLLLDWEKFTTETLATVRGNDAYFRKVPFHKGVFHFTSMPTGDSPLFSFGEYYNDTEMDIRSISDARIDLQVEFMKAQSKKEKLELWEEIDELSNKLRFFPDLKSKHLYTEYNSFDNIENLGLKYLQQQFDSQPLVLFMTEILNKRLTKIVDSFYPFLDRGKHGYKGNFDYSFLDNLDLLQTEESKTLDSRQDADCVKTEPLHVGIDFGAAINWFITAQYFRSIHTVNFIKNDYVKSPLIIDDLAKKWCDYYEHHKKKLVYLYPGADGHNRTANVKGQTSYVQQIQKILRQRGWLVVVKKAAKFEYAHHEKYLCWARALSQSDKRYPNIKFNLINCKELFFVMEQTPANDYGGKIEKNKSSERKLIQNREQATDAGDAADQILFSLFGHLNKVGGVIATSKAAI
jgi:hypothetical protein